MLYTGSFSKTLLPSLRLGFVVVPASLRPAMHAAKYVTDWSSSTPQQLALAEFIDRGWFARHLRAMRALYRERHRLISTLLDEQFTGVLREVPSGAGLHLSAVADGMSADECTAVVHAAAARGVAAYSLGSFGLLEPRVAGVVIGYGAVAARATSPPASRPCGPPSPPDRRAPRWPLIRRGQTLDVRSAQNGARSSRLRILPEPVFGSSSSHEIERGTL